jgi:RHS repeat-associated protein
MVASILNPLEGGLSYEYDEVGRVTSITNTNNQIELYTYNADGLLESIDDANNNQTTYVYDQLGRIVRLEDELGSITYTYDKNSNIVEVEDEKGTISRTYDALNRVKTYTDYKGQTVEYSYDELGNLISLTYPGGEIVRYTYYENGTLESVKDWNNRVTNYYYTDSSKISRIERPDGTTVEYEYDVAGRRTSMKDIKEDTKAVISEEIYTYDDAGQITTISKSANESSSVESANNIKSVTMAYDSDNRLLTYNGEEVQYDENGNMVYGPLNGEMVTYEYDCRNRLINAGEVSYEYDAEDQRIAVNEANKRTEYVINSNTELSQVLKVTEYDLTEKAGTNEDLSIVQEGEGNTQEGQVDNQVDQATTQVEQPNDQTEIKTEVTSYVYGTGLLSQNSETTGYLTYHFNQVGSTTALTDQAGKVVQNYSYDPYGELLAENTESEVPDNSTEENSDTILDNTTDKTATDITNTPETEIRFLYNGEYGVITDANNLYFMRERYYNVDSKRFINQDVLVGSISDSASLNRYAYVQGNPITYVDPLGLSPYSIISTLGHSLLNVVGFVPGIGDLFDGVNGIWYALEGNSKEAISSFISVLPFIGSSIGNGLKWGSKGAKWATKASKYIDATCNIIAGASTLYRSSDSAANRVLYLYDNYIKTGKKFDSRAAVEILGLALDVTSSVLAGKQMKGGIGGLCKQAKEDRQLRKALDGYSVADGKSPYALMEQYGIPATLNKSSREALDAGGYQMKASESGGPSGKYQVGDYQDIKGVEGLDAHHVGQKAVMKNLVENYDPKTAPAINVPKVGHTISGPNGIVSRNTKGIVNTRQVLARDLFELKRVYPDIPNSSYRELIDMNIKMYPEMRK